MSRAALARVMGEPLINAREAAESLQLPLWWFMQTPARQRRAIPHYYIHKSVRFKLSELHAWARQYEIAPRTPETARD